jgi:hypothetical protein
MINICFQLNIDLHNRLLSLIPRENLAKVLNKPKRIWVL